MTSLKRPDRAGDRFTVSATGGKVRLFAGQPENPWQEAEDAILRGIDMQRLLERQP